MSERLFARLAARLHEEALVLATVLDTRGATPRKQGSRMLIAEHDSDGSIGGGLLEARVIAAAREMLAYATAAQVLDIDLSGRDGAAGICGGSMRIVLRRWQGEQDRARAEAVASSLASGEPVALAADDLGAAATSASVYPAPRLLIIGAGHCGAALYDLAQHLEFDLWLYDERADIAVPEYFPLARVLSGAPEELHVALRTTRELDIVCLNRDFAADVAALEVVGHYSPRFLGLMGSRRRIAEVLAALPADLPAVKNLRAPVGLEIGAETPQEIAVSILAELLQAREMERTPA